MSENLAGMSWTELREATAAIEREIARREAVEQAAQAEAFRTELAEVKAGTRRADPEHIAYLSPAEALEAVNRGQMVHAGIGPDKRLRRR
jgi:putative hemolysin